MAITVDQFDPMKSWRVPTQAVHLRCSRGCPFATSLRLDEFFCGLRDIDCMDTPVAVTLYGGFHKCGYPKLAGWFISWKILLKWMITRGTP